MGGEWRLRKVSKEKCGFIPESEINVGNSDESAFSFDGESFIVW